MPPLAVIPSFVLVGPLAVVAALFPGVAAWLATGVRKWRAFLVVAGANTTLAIVYAFTRNYLPDWSVFGERGFTAVLLALTALGLMWAGRRYRRAAGEDPTITATPTRRELAVLAGVSILLALLVVTIRLVGYPWSVVFDVPMREFTLSALALFAATLYAGYRTITRSTDNMNSPVQLSLSGETVGPRYAVPRAAGRGRGRRAGFDSRRHARHGSR